MVKATNGKELEPSVWVWFDIVDKFKQSGECAAKAAGDLVQHEGGVADGVVTQLSSEFLLGDIHTVHLDNSPTITFD